jgi:YidC/Oxa1 family membrane protein insertase
LAAIYDLIPDYGVTIIVMTILIRLVLLPLGIKQIKSMQHTQALQPKIKELQKRFKGNKQKLQEETMKLYREAGVNPLSGCLPLLLQFPFLIAMYAILRAPTPNAAYESQTATPNQLEFLNNHLPIDSELYRDVTTGEDMDFLFMNLQCSLVQAGTQATVQDSERKPSDFKHDCGDARFPDAIPYGLMLAVMIGSTLYSQRQMQSASPPGAANQQQQTLMRIMPVMFGVFGLQFPAGLVLYWTISNLIQLGQQTFLLRAGHIGPQAMERRLEESKAKAATKSDRKGFLSRVVERAETAQKQRNTARGKGQPRRSPPPGKRTPGKGGGGSSRSKSNRPRREPGSRG